MMLVVDAANAAQALDRILVVQPASQRITGIGRQRDDAAAIDNLNRLLDQSELRIIRMNLKELAHREKRRQPNGCRRRNLIDDRMPIQRMPRKAEIRSSIGGWLENSSKKPGLSLMPIAAIDCGRLLFGSALPRRASALIIGCGLPSSCAEPASARYSR